MNPVLGALIVGAAHVPFAYEVIVQLRTQARLYALIPEQTRRTFPRAPSRPSLVFLGTPRFFRAFGRYVFADIADESREIVALKTRLRKSIRRKVWFAIGGLAIAIALVALGWRPFSLT